MAKKGKKSKMVHISKLHKNHPYVKAVRTRTTAGYVVLALILLGLIGVIIWGFVTNWGAGQGKDNYSCSSCTRYSTQDVEDSPEEKFTANHCGKHLAGQCNSFPPSKLTTPGEPCYGCAAPGEVCSGIGGDGCSDSRQCGHGTWVCQAGSCPSECAQNDFDDVSEKFTANHCGKHLAGQCTEGFDDVSESYCCGRPPLPSYGEEFDAGVF